MIALRRVGHEVHIYERSAFNNETGAAIHIPPNAARPLLSWGFDPVRSKLVVVKSSYRASGTTLERLHMMTHDSLQEEYGAPWFFSHRVDLHTELKRLATGPEGSGVPVQVHLSSEVVEFVPGAGLVRLSNGQTISGDLVIAADGIHSAGVKAVLGQENPPKPQKDYNFCFRFLIPTSDIEADAATSDWTEGCDGRIKAFLGENKRLVSYPCRNGEIHNFVAIFHTDDGAAQRPEDWQASVGKSELLDQYHDFHPTLRAVMAKATEIKQWALLYRPPLSTWRKDRMVLVGDAAHPMLPHQGQGGAQGIEDGVAMGIVMAGAQADQVQERLRVFEGLRRKRCSAMQIFSNAGQDEVERVRAEASEFMPVDEIPKNPEQFVVFNFAYDIVRDAVAHMQKLEPAYALPAGFF